MPWKLEYLICGSKGFGEGRLIDRLLNARMKFDPARGQAVYTCKSRAEFDQIVARVLSKPMALPLWADVRFVNELGETRNHQAGDLFEVLIPAEALLPAANPPFSAPAANAPGPLAPATAVPPPAKPNGQPAKKKAKPAKPQPKAKAKPAPVADQPPPLP